MFSTVFCFVVCWGIFKPGTSQSLITLERRDTSSLVACQNEIAEFSCGSSGSRAQWIVEPLIPAMPPGTVVAINGQFGVTLFEESGIHVLSVSANPLRTSLIVNGSSLSSEMPLTVSCSSTDGTIESRPLISGDEVEPPSNLQCLVSNGTFICTFSLSPSPDIIKYVLSLYCDNNACRAVEFITTTEVVTGRVEVAGTEIRVKLTAENRCGVNSSAVRTSVGTGSSLPMTGNILPPSNLSCEPCLSAFQEGSFSCSFTPSTSQDIRYYSLSCLDGTCTARNVTTTEVRMDGSASIGGIKHRIRLCAINESGAISDMIETEVVLQTIIGYVVLVFLFCVALIAIIILTIISVLACVKSYKAKGDTQTFQGRELK